MADMNQEIAAAHRIQRSALRLVAFLSRMGGENIVTVRERRILRTAVENWNELLAEPYEES